MNILAVPLLMFWLWQTPTPLPKPPDVRGLEEVNEYRLEHNLNPVVRNEKVCEYARLRLTQIPTDWSHDRFLVGNEQPKRGYWVENLAKGFDRSPVTAWKGSPTHDANLLADVSEMCLERAGTYWVLEGWRR